MNSGKGSARTVTVCSWMGDILAYPYYAAKPAKELFGRASSLYVRRCPEPLGARSALENA